MQALINALYPNRIQVVLGSIPGPITSTTSDPFDPRTAFEVYVAGQAVTLLSFSYDASANQYKIFTAQPIDTTELVQVIHHMPSPPYETSSGAFPGFAAIASVTSTPDVFVPSVGLSVPSSVVVNRLVPFTWNATDVAQIRITATTGYDSGLVASNGAAGVVYASGFVSSGSYTATVAAYDAEGNAISVSGTPLTASIPLVITTN